MTSGCRSRIASGISFHRHDGKGGTYFQRTAKTLEWTAKSQNSSKAFLVPAPRSLLPRSLLFAPCSLFLWLTWTPLMRKITSQKPKTQTLFLCFIASDTSLNFIQR